MEETRRWKSTGSAERPSTLSANFTFGSRKLSKPAAGSRTAWPGGFYVQGRKSIRGEGPRTGDASNRSLPKPFLLVTAREDVHTEEKREGRGGRERKGNDVKKNRGSRGAVGGVQGRRRGARKRQKENASHHPAVAGQEAWLYGGSGMRSSSWASGSFVIRNTSRYCARGREKGLPSRPYVCEMGRKGMRKKKKIGEKVKNDGFHRAIACDIGSSNLNSQSST